MPAPAFRAGPVRVQAPASSANLGPGFDAMALALALHDTVVVRVAESGLTVDVAGEGEDTVPRSGRHLVVRALRAAFDRLGGQPRGIDVVCANRIPHGRGLGSSAAAVVSGILAARALTLGGPERLDGPAVLALAAELEGHPDNVAACLSGGATLAWAEPDRPRSIRLPTGPDLAVTVFVAGGRSSTAKARRLLPTSVPHRDAAANAARAALLVEALARPGPLLLAATEDRLHQAYRAPAMPRTAALVARLRAAGIAATVSGAGPSVLALTAGGAAADALVAFAGRGFTAHRLEIDHTGANAGPYRGEPAP